jgi:hypothetical protein
MFAIYERGYILNKLELLRYSALAEGLSWLALLFIAMPLK